MARIVHKLVLLGLAATVAASAAEPVESVVATDSTDPLNQSESAATVSVFADHQVEVIAINDGDPNVTYANGTRYVTAGNSLAGWYYRERTTLDNNPAWQHGRLAPNPAMASVVWSDPAIDAAPDVSGLVFMSYLMIPPEKFADAPYCNDVGENCLEGALTDHPTPGGEWLGGACVARSTDGGKTFDWVDCFGDKEDIGGNSSDGHFWDGMDVAVQYGANPSMYVASRDTETSREALWRLDQSSTGTTFVKEQTATGTVGQIDGELGTIGSHPRLRIAPDNTLWRMSYHSDWQTNTVGLKVNVLGRNGPPVVVADNYTQRDVSLPNLPTGNHPNPDQEVRLGPQYDLEIGLNESMQPEMRFVYLARDTAGTYIQGGYCTMDLADCQTPPNWRTYGVGGDSYFHPAISYGLDTLTGTPHWKISYYQVDQSQTHVAIFASDLVRDPSDPTLQGAQYDPGEQLTDWQVPCPDARGYWGDYDDMAFNSARCTFIRPFTDSTLGCPSRTNYTSHVIDVSAVEVICDPDRAGATVTLSGENDSQFSSTEFELCATGSGFTPNADIAVTVEHPAYPAPYTVYGTTADVNGDFVAALYSVWLLFPRVLLCDSAEYEADSRVIFTDLTSGLAVEASEEIPKCWFCQNVTPPGGGPSYSPTCAITLGGGCG